MKKLFLTLGIACLFMTACNNAPKEAQVEEQPVVEEAAPVEVCPMDNFKAQLADWANYDEAKKAEVVGAIKTFFDEKDAQMAEGKECCQKEGEEITEEMKAKMDEMKAKMEPIMEKWANWAEMTVEDQKALIEERFAAMQCCEKPAEEPAPAE